MKKGFAVYKNEKNPFSGAFEEMLSSVVIGNSEDEVLGILKRRMGTGLIPEFKKIFEGQVSVKPVDSPINHIYKHEAVVDGVATGLFIFIREVPLEFA